MSASAARLVEAEGAPDPRATYGMLAVGLLVVGLVFQVEILAAVATWEASTAYNHCFLIVPISAYLIWDRKETLEGLQPRPAAAWAALGLPVALGWLIAERLGIMEGRQLMVVSMAQVLFLAVLGRRLYGAVLGPLLYLYFAVPFGEFLVPKLQDITAVFVEYGIQYTGIPAYIDGYIIEIPEGTFFVAEACAGLRFLIASIAFGVLYALLMYRGPVRRTVFMLVSIAVPIVANGFRALGIVALGHILGSAEAAAADHVLYGWIFFSIVILILIALGLPFRQDLDRRPPSRPQPVDGPSSAVSSALATAFAIAVAAIGPGAALALDRAAAARVAEARALDMGPDCRAASMPWPGARSAAGGAVAMRVACGDDAFDVLVQTFPAGSTAGPVMAERRRLTRPPRSENVNEQLIEAPGKWRLVRSPEPASVAAAGMWIDGEAALPGWPTRIAMARASLTGGRVSPVLIVVAPVGDMEGLRPAQREAVGRALAAFVAARGGFDAQARAMAGGN